MTTAIIAESSAPTVADLLERLGNVPASRVRLHPPPGQATERDVLDIHARTDRLFELIGGVLVEWAYSFRNSVLSAIVGSAICRFAIIHDLGIVTGADGAMRLSPQRIRMPAVSFVSWNQLPKRQVPAEPIPNLYPDLAVEVLSESNTPREMELKRIDYFRAGTRLVWQFDAERRAAEVYKSLDDPQVLISSQTLDGGDVLPGFTLSLGELFGALDEQSATPGNG